MVKRNIIQQLEILKRLRIIHGDKINPHLHSLKYCQSDGKSFLEAGFSEYSIPIITTLDVFSEIIQNQKGEDDLVDNAQKFTKLDEDTLALCIDYFFHQKIRDEILKPRPLEK